MVYADHVVLQSNYQNMHTVINSVAMIGGVKEPINDLEVKSMIGQMENAKNVKQNYMVFSNLIILNPDLLVGMIMMRKIPRHYVKHAIGKKLGTNMQMGFILDQITTHYKFAMSQEMLTTIYAELMALIKDHNYKLVDSKNNTLFFNKIIGYLLWTNNNVFKVLVLDREIEYNQLRFVTEVTQNEIHLIFPGSGGFRISLESKENVIKDTYHT